jgi:glucan-binding YG repeat protein
MSQEQNLEKHMEGTNLALSAVAEVLAKMDERLTKEEEEDRIDEEEKAIQAEKADLVKAVASEVVSMIKEENPLGMDVDGSKERKAKAAAPQYDDAQAAANPTTKIEDQQATIQAADMEDDDEKEKASYKAEDDDNGSDEEPVDKEVCTRLYSDLNTYRNRLTLQWILLQVFLILPMVGKFGMR